MMLRAVELGLVDDVSEVLRTLDNAILGKHADSRVGDGVLGLAQHLAAFRRV